MNFDILLKYVTKASRDMWDMGWAEANAGNISLRLNEEQFAIIEQFKPKADWVKLESAVPNLAGERFMFTGAGRYLRNIELAPERNIGFIELDKTGAAYRIMWGFEPNGRPTSELPAHLLSHSAIKESTNNTARAVIHTHAPNLIALTYTVENLSKAKLSKLLWQMHAECVVVFPQGIEFIPFQMPGSLELGEATADALTHCPMAVWQHHGVCGTGKSLDEAFGRIFVAEKAAGIYLKSMAAGGIKQVISDDDMRAVAANFDVPLDVSLL
jgi:rhamnulose-1-phosphate aldolase